MTAIISIRKKIWLQFRKSRWVLLTLISGRISSRGTFQLLHSYLFPNRNDCSHIWTFEKLRLQSYLDPNMSDIALIIGPLYTQVTHIISISGDDIWQWDSDIDLKRSTPVLVLKFLKPGFPNGFLRKLFSNHFSQKPFYKYINM